MLDPELKSWLQGCGVDSATMDKVSAGSRLEICSHKQTLYVYHSLPPRLSPCQMSFTTFQDETWRT